MDNENQQTTGGIRMSHVFTAVVALHVLVIGGAILMSQRAKQTALAKATPTRTVTPAEPADLPEPQEPAEKAPVLRSNNEPHDETFEVAAEDAVEPAAPAPRKTTTAKTASPLPAPVAARSEKMMPPVAALRGGTPVAARPAVAATSGSTTYTVVKGDTLSRIARRLKVSQQAIIAANGIKDPSKLAIGTKLVVPASAVTRSADKPATRRSSPETVAVVNKP